MHVRMAGMWLHAEGLNFHGRFTNHLEETH